MIFALQKQDTDQLGPDDTKYKKNSYKMAELARNYHDDLQHEHNSVDNTVRARKMEEVLGNISSKAMEAQRQSLTEEILKAKILEALKHSSNNLAAGVDGSEA